MRTDGSGTQAAAKTQKNIIYIPPAEVVEELGYNFGRGFFRAFAEYEADTLEAAAAVTETITPTEREKTQIADCKECLCNTCARIELCIAAPADWKHDAIRPYPCTDCIDGMRYINLDEICSGYVAGAENNG